MQVVIGQLVHSAVYFVACSFIMGAVFDRFDRGLWRDGIIGFVGGLTAFIVMSMPAVFNGYVIDGRTPILVVTSFFSGPFGAAVAVAMPLALRIELGGPAVLLGVGAIVAAAILGAGLRALHDRRAWTVTRRSVLVLAALSPLVLVTMLLPQPRQVEPMAVLHIVLPLLVWLPLGSAMFGILLVNELARSDAKRERAERMAFLTRTEHVGPEVFENQLHQLWQLHNRYGTPFVYLLVAIDDGVALARTTSRRNWTAIQARVGRCIKMSVRDCDICAPIGADRFSVLLPHTGRAGVAPVAARIQAAIGKSIRFEGEPITVSIGIASVDESSGPSDLAILAESALVRANAAKPREAIGPSPLALQATDAVVRSFPGAVADGAARLRSGAARSAESRALQTGETAEIVPINQNVRAQPK